VFGDDDVALMRALADQVAVALESAASRRGRPERGALPRRGRRNDRPIADEGGRPADVQSVGRDVIEHRHLEGRVFQCRKREAVGQLAAGLAGRREQPARRRRGTQSPLARRAGSGDPRCRQAEEIATAGDQLVALTRQLLVFGRRQVLRPVLLDLGAALARLEPILRRVVAKDVQLRIHTASPGAATCDPTQIEDVILRLVLYAREAMPRGGQLEVGTISVELDEGQAEPLELAAGRYAVLTVRDDGAGLDRNTGERLFEPFFTTKARSWSKGVGLGLAVVYGIGKQRGGHIPVTRAPRRRAEVSVYLPFSETARP